MYICPVCDYAELEYPPKDYNICDQCGTEFGNDDEILTHEQLRRKWVRKGRKFFYKDKLKPEN